jgi:AcrR family transcriptional regulator
MSTYEQTGRSRQKQRTRGALVDATRQLLASGVVAPTVEQAAEAASISRTTAYRYFPSQKALLIAAHPETQTESLLPEDPGADPAVRLDAASRAFIALTIDTEQQLRTMLRLSLEPSAEPGELPLRQGRAIGWFIDALSPLVPTLGADGVRRLAVAVRSAVGIEALIWLTDIGGLDRDEATDLMLWSAQSMLGRALAGVLPPG